MKALLDRSIAEGGLGLSSTVSVTHNDADGKPVPSRHASDEELYALAAVCKDHPGTTIEFLPAAGQFTDEDIERMTRLSLWSMGSGAGCDAQYLFATDVLGETRGHIPRHSKVYRNFAAEYDRLQRERVAAFREFIDDVQSGEFPETGHVVNMQPAELESFLARIDAD